MKKSLLLLFLTPALAFGQDTLSVNAEQRAFCLNVIKSIIEHDCESYVASIADSVVLYASIHDTLLSKEAFKPQLAMLCYASVKNDSLNYQYYLDNFHIRFYDVNVIADGIGFGRNGIESNLSDLKYYKIKEDDIFFNGAYHKTRNRLDFILDDAFKFVFRKVNGEYRIVVITP